LLLLQELFRQPLLLLQQLAGLQYLQVTTAQTADTSRQEVGGMDVYSTSRRMCCFSAWLVQTYLS
jgi:hypothetical protein